MVYRNYKARTRPCQTGSKKRRGRFYEIISIFARCLKFSEIPLMFLPQTVNTNAVTMGSPGFSNLPGFRKGYANMKKAVSLICALVIALLLTGCQADMKTSTPKGSTNSVTVDTEDKQNTDGSGFGKQDTGDTGGTVTGSKPAGDQNGGKTDNDTVLDSVLPDDAEPHDTTENGDVENGPYDSGEYKEGVDVDMEMDTGTQEDEAEKIVE